MKERTHLGETGRAVGRRLRTTREKADLSFRALADKVDRKINKDALWHMETGGRRIDVDDLVAIAEALDVSPVWLLGYERCSRCDGAPPAGFTCQTCGEEGEPA